MAEEEKVKTPEPEKKDTGEAAKKALKIILGIILVALGVAGICFWWIDVLTVVRGCLGVFLILTGLICFLVAAE